MRNIINFFIPKETKFFEMLAVQAENIAGAANALREFFHSYNKLTEKQRQACVARIKELETKGDTLTHDIINMLNMTFITPLDREDIHQLATYMDDVLDCMNLAAKRMFLYKVGSADHYMEEICEIIVKSVEHMRKCMSGLSKLHNIKRHYVAIQELENKADHVHDKALAELFANAGKNKKADQISTMKLMDIYGFLEGVTDKCEAIAHVLEGIVVKHS